MCYIQNTKKCITYTHKKKELNMNKWLPWSGVIKLIIKIKIYYLSSFSIILTEMDLL